MKCVYVLVMNCPTYLLLLLFYPEEYLAMINPSHRLHWIFCDLNDTLQPTKNQFPKRKPVWRGLEQIKKLLSLTNFLFKLPWMLGTQETSRVNAYYASEPDQEHPGLDNLPTALEIRRELCLLTPVFPVWLRFSPVSNHWVHLGQSSCFTHEETEPQQA